MRLRLPNFKEIATILGMMLVGLVWPDIDLAIPFLPHRSALTHSILVPVALLGIGFLRGPATGGMLLGVSVSLTADLFPRAWIGFANVHLPLWGSLGWMSPVWLVVNILAALILAQYELTGGGRRSRPLIPYVALGILATGYALTVEHSLWPLLAFPVLWFISIKLAAGVFGPEQP
ncbi:MAG: hypothetical protein WCF85_17985 [Rhodospirillaceae bacterium]